MDHFDIVIVGGGGAGLYAAMEVLNNDKSLNVAVISKIYPNRSHTSAAQGGANAALANKDKSDTVDKHTFDTVKGSDYLADQDAAAVLCEEAPTVMRELENLGTPFSRLEDGTIAQRPFGGASSPRCCYCADKTGHTILQTLYEQCLRLGVNFYNEYFILSLEHDNGKCQGITALNIKTGKIEVFPSKVVIFATGGYAKAYWNRSSNAAGNTGDGPAAALRAGIPLKDMEFVQFHPTGLRKSGILVTEGARGEGGYLFNNESDRFMSKYAPEKMELGPRDLVSRSIEREILEGRGFDSDAGKYVKLDLTHLGPELIKKRLPQIRELSISFEGVDPIEEPIPIRPTAHYSMGGIDCDKTGRTIMQGVYAIGECACVSVHGANRLGGNSLLEILVFGKIAGREAANEVKGFSKPSIPDSAIDKYTKYFRSLAHEGQYERYAVIREEMGQTLADNVAIFRNAKDMKKAVDDIKTLRERFKRVKLHDTGKVFNTNLINILELRNMLSVALTISAGAYLRKESRGSHFRTDYTTRDDENWHKHTMFTLKEGELKIDYKPVTMGKYPLEERKY